VWSIIVLSVVAGMGVGSVYIEVDTVNCANIMDDLSLTDDYVDFKYNGVVEYDLSDISVQKIDQPTFHLNSEFADAGYEAAAVKKSSTFMRKYRLQEATNIPAYSTIAMLMTTSVVFSPPTAFANTDTRAQIEDAVRKINWEAIMLVKSSPTTVTVEECYWTELVRSSQKVLVCALMLDRKKCAYRLARNVWLGLDGHEWAIGLISLMSGLGNLVFKIDFAKSIQSGKMDCADSSALVDVRGLSMKRCENRELLATCFEQGRPCTLAMIEAQVSKFWQVYSIMTNTDPALIDSRGVSSLSTPGEFRVVFDDTQIQNSNVAESLEIKYFKNSVKRPCLLGLVPGDVLVREYGFYYQFACRPCLFNTYYAELPTPRTSATEDTTKTKTLYLGIVAIQGTVNNEHMYRLVERESEFSEKIYSESLSSAFAVAIAAGTTVTVYIEDRLEFEKVRAHSAIVSTTSIENAGATVLTITIQNIYGEDADDADGPIFIDVRPIASILVRNQDYLAILPIRHPLQQVCQPCPDDHVTTGYATNGIAACTKLDGARRVPDVAIDQSAALRSTNTRETPLAPTPLLNTIAGFQLRSIVYDAENAKMQMFLETSARVAGIHNKEIADSARSFLGMDSDSSDVIFSVSTSDIVDIQVLESDEVGPKRRVLETAEAPAISSVELVSVVVHMEQAQDVANKNTISNMVYIIAGGSVLLVLVGILIWLTVYVCRDPGYKMEPVSQIEIYDM